MKQLLTNHIRCGFDWEIGIDCTVQIKPTITVWLRFLCFYLVIF